MNTAGEVHTSTASINLKQSTIETRPPNKETQQELSRALTELSPCALKRTNTVANTPSKGVKLPSKLHYNAYSYS